MTDDLEIPTLFTATNLIIKKITKKKLSSKQPYWQFFQKQKFIISYGYELLSHCQKTQFMQQQQKVVNAFLFSPRVVCFVL